MKKKENFLEFQIILFTIHDNSRFAVISYINIARIQNRPCSQHRSIHVLVPNCNSKNRKTYHNCTTRVLHTVISTQSPSIDSNDYSPSPPFFFSSLSFFISLSSSRYLSLFFLNVRPSFLFMFWQLMVSVAVSAAG